MRLEMQKELQKEQAKLGIQPPPMMGGPMGGAPGQPPMGGPPKRGQPPMGAPPMGGPPPMGKPPMGTPQEMGGSNVNVIDLAEAWARKISRMDPVRSQNILTQMEQQSPNLHKIVLEKLQLLKSMSQEPLPEQRPPRREEGVI